MYSAEPLGRVHTVRLEEIGGKECFGLRESTTLNEMNKHEWANGLPIVNFSHESSENRTFGTRYNESIAPLQPV